MKNIICLLLTCAVTLSAFPVSVSAGSIDDVNAAFAPINGNGGHVEASECVLDETSKVLHLMVVQNENERNGDTSTFCDNVSNILNSFPSQNWYDYDYVIEDALKVGYNGVIATSINDLTNDSRSWAAWGTAIYEDRISDGQILKKGVLEDIQESSESDSKSSDSLDDVGRLNPGVYIIGEDIPAGKYTFSITDGAGIISVYDSYDDYKNDDYEHSEEYHVASKKYKESLGSDLESINSLYSSEIGNLPLENGMCVKIDTVSVLYLAK
mgnify:FL=1|jgi:hypothetical protein